MKLPETVSTPRAPAPTGPFAQARRAGNLLFISGQRGLDPATGKPAGSTVEARGRQAMENLKAIAEAAGGSMESFVSTAVYVTDMKAHRPAINKLYEEYFGPHLPARTLVEVRALSQDDIVEIEAVVLLPGE